jgi:hypothetical protein
LATLIGDYIKDLSKLNWKVKATIGKSFKWKQVITMMLN